MKPSAVADHLSTLIGVARDLERQSFHARHLEEDGALEWGNVAMLHDAFIETSKAFYALVRVASDAETKKRAMR